MTGGSLRSESPSPAPSEDLIHGQNLRVTVCANQGGRKYMEDRVHIHCARKDDGQIDFVFVAVYDGHGGAEASEYARRHLLNAIIGNELFQSDRDEEVLEAIRQGFVDTHHAMWKVVDEWPRTASGFPSTAGTTASVAFIRRGKIYTGHVGDSAIILGKRGADGSIVGTRITVDHKPDSPEEQQRIEQAGGQVQCKAGVMRVVWSRPVRGHTGPVRRSTPQEHIPFLAVARALGDLWSYNSDNKDFIVSPDPDTEVVQIGADDVCLVLGSDGLTNVIRPQYAVDIVNTHEWRELEEERGCHAQLLSRPCHSNHSRWLLRHGLRGWGGLRADNITVLTVLFDPPGSQLEASAPCVLRDDIWMDADQVLTHQPDAMIRIAPETTQLLKTAPVELIYTGARDQPINGLFNWTKPLATNYSGPGFNATSDNVILPRMMPSAQRPPAGRMMMSGGPVRQVPITVERSESSEAEDPPPRPSSPLPTTNGDVTSSAPVDEDDDADDRCNEVSASVEGDPQRRRSFFCTKHGLVCDKVKKMNVEAERNPATAAVCLNRQAGSAKPKYYCRKHGLSCAKVKKMNDEHERVNGALPSSPSKVVGQPPNCSANVDDDHDDQIGPIPGSIVNDEKNFDPSPIHNSSTTPVPPVVPIEAEVEEQPDLTPAKRRVGRPPKSANRQTRQSPSETAVVDAPLAAPVTPLAVAKRRGRPPKSSQSAKTTRLQRIVCTRLWARTTRSAKLVTPARSAPARGKKSTPGRSTRRTTISDAPPSTPQTPKRSVGRPRKLSQPTMDDKLPETVGRVSATGGDGGKSSASHPSLGISRPHSAAAMTDGRCMRRSYRQLTVETAAFSSLLQSNISPRLLARSEANGTNKRKLPPQSVPTEPTTKKSRFWGFLSNIIGTK